MMRDQKFPIRTLSLLPGDECDDIQCSTQTRELGSGETYCALSYVWGSPVECNNIFVDGDVVGVTTNLYNALKRLRRIGQPRRLWIDQLCIDQDDAKEKAAQVGQMRHIYKQCEECLIWLGELPISDSLTVDDAEAALEFVRFCGQYGRDQWLTTETPAPSRLSTLSDTQLNGLRYAFEALFRSEWWSRIWTLQEAVLPPRCVVLWGPLSLDWQFFDLGARNLCNGPSPKSVIPAVFNRLSGVLDSFTGQVRGLEFARSERDGIVNLIQRWRHRGATEPRDKIYAMMGLCPPALLPSVPFCDYHEASVEDLYQRVTLDLVHTDMSLHPLVELRPDPLTSELRLPSWAINFAVTAPVATEAWWWDPSQRYHWYDACGPMRLRSKLKRDEHGVLHGLVGIKVDTVRAVGEICPSEFPELTPLGDLRRTANSWRQMTQKWPRYPDGGRASTTADEAFLRCLVGNLLRNEFPAGTPSKADLATIRHFCEDGTRPPSLVFNSLCRLVANHAFFTTGTGYFGVGQPHVRPGDEVWVLGGSRMPFLLGPVPGTVSTQPGDDGSSGGGVAYGGARECERALVGSCYLHGIMIGEMVSSGQTLTEIRLV